MTKAKILAAAALAAFATPAHAQSIGVNAAIRNSVTIKTASDAAPRPAKLKERVSQGDAIATAAASTLQILLLDRTTITVGANARLKIDRFVYDPGRRASAVGASVAKGAFRFMSGKAMRGAPGQSSITTPVATIGVRGTIVEGVVGADAARIARGESAVGAGAGNDANATLIILRGPGAATQGDERPGGIDVIMGATTTSMDRPGLALFVPAPGQAAIGPFVISDAGLAALTDLLRASPDARRSGTIDIEGNPIVDMILECEGGSLSEIIRVDPIVGSNQSSSQLISSSSSSSSSGGCRTGG